MRILAIDPGPSKSACIVFDTDAYTICSSYIYENEDLLRTLPVLVQDFSCQHLAVEMIANYGMAAGASLFDTCVWIGRFVEACKLSHELIFRSAIKLHLCNSVRAKDGNIRQALIDRFEPGLQPKQRPRGVLKNIAKDLWAALALAVTFADRENRDG